MSTVQKRIIGLIVLLGVFGFFELVAARDTGVRSPKKFLFFLGGSGEPPGADTIFDASVVDLLQTSREAGYEIHAAYNGGHTQSEKMIERALGHPAGALTPATYRQMIADVREKIRTGVIRPGDQVMIANINHGHPGRGKKSAHSVACGQTECDLNLWAEPLRELESKGVRTAFFDGSCYSGNSLDLASDKTCVITASPRNDVSLVFSIWNLVLQLKSGRDLESSFLAAQSNRLLSKLKNFNKMQMRSFLSTLPQRPQISTPAGRVTENFLERIHFFGGLSSVRSGGCESCKSAADPDLKQAFVTLFLLMPELDQKLQRYVQLSAEYSKKRDRIQRVHSQIWEEGMTLFSSASVAEADRCDVPWGYLVSPGFYESQTRRALPEACRKAKQEAWGKNEKFRSYLQKTQPMFHEYLQYGPSWIEGQDFEFSSLKKDAAQILELEQELYQEIYENFSEEKQKNACKNFVF